jgi:hypothetical protein
VTEPEDLSRLGIGVAADPKPLRMPGESPRRRYAHVVAWFALWAAIVAVAAGVAAGVAHLASSK